MVHLRRSPLLALCAALVACADGTSRPQIAGPDEDAIVALTRPDGNRVFPLVPGAGPSEFYDAARLRMPSAGEKAGIAQGASAKVPGSARGTGNVDIVYLAARQQYTFTVQSGAQPPAATGTIRVAIVHANYQMEIEATVDCVLASGNEAWISGPVTRFLFDGVARPATIHLLLEVRDNGEGRGSPPDLASPPFGAGAQACMLESSLPMFSNDPGRVRLSIR